MAQGMIKEEETLSLQQSTSEPDLDILIDEMISRLRTTYYALRGIPLH